VTRPDTNQVLLIGYGNPARRDDGLGPALAEAVSAMQLEGVTVDADYQLHVENAAEAAPYEVVVFADAHTSCTEPFVFERLEPKAEVSFTSHSVSPQAVLGMAHELFSSRVRGYLLGIRGHAFEGFGEELSPRARTNLAAATEYLETVLRNRSFDDAITGTDTGSALKRT